MVLTQGNNDTQALMDTAVLNLLIANELRTSIIGDMLDSLVNVKFFTNTTFPADTTVLNVNYYPAGIYSCFQRFGSRIKD